MKRIFLIILLLMPLISLAQKQEIVVFGQEKGTEVRNDTTFSFENLLIILDEKGTDFLEPDPNLRIYYADFILNNYDDVKGNKTGIVKEIGFFQKKFKSKIIQTEEESIFAFYNYDEISGELCECGFIALESKFRLLNINAYKWNPQEHGPGDKIYDIRFKIKSEEECQQIMTVLKKACSMQLLGGQVQKIN